MGGHHVLPAAKQACRASLGAVAEYSMCRATDSMQGLASAATYLQESKVSGTLTYSFRLCSCLQTRQASGTCRPAEQLAWQGLACHVLQHFCSRWLLGRVCVTFVHTQL